MKRLLLILCFLPLFAQSQVIFGLIKQDTIPTPPGDTIAYSGRTNFFYGDSYFGGGWITGGITIPAQFATETSSTATSRGVGGAVLQNGNSCGNRYVMQFENLSSYDSATCGLVFIALGTNDIGMFQEGMPNMTFTPSGYQARLESMIDSMNTIYGVPLRRIVVIGPYYTQDGGKDFTGTDGSCGVTSAASQTRFDNYNAASSAAASSKGTQYINMSAEQIATGNPDGFMLGDQLHPNNAGALFICHKMQRTYYQ